MPDPETRIREDRYGKFVSLNGYVYRPLFPIGYNHKYASSTLFEVKTKVHATSMVGTPLAKIGIETWFCHGMFDSTADHQRYKPKSFDWEGGIR